MNHFGGVVKDWFRGYWMNFVEFRINKWLIWLETTLLQWKNHFSVKSDWINHSTSKNPSRKKRNNLNCLNQSLLFTSPEESEIFSSLFSERRCASYNIWQRMELYNSCVSGWETLDSSISLILFRKATVYCADYDGTGPTEDAFPIWFLIYWQKLPTRIASCPDERFKHSNGTLHYFAIPNSLTTTLALNLELSPLYHKRGMVIEPKMSFLGQRIFPLTPNRKQISIPNQKVTYLNLYASDRKHLGKSLSPGKERVYWDALELSFAEYPPELLLHGNSNFSQ